MHPSSRAVNSGSGNRPLGDERRLRFCDSVCLYTHDKTKTAVTKSPYLTQLDSPSRYLTRKLILGQKDKGQGHQKVQKGDRVVGVSYALYRVRTIIFCNLTTVIHGPIQPSMIGIRQYDNGSVNYFHLFIYREESVDGEAQVCVIFAV